MKDHILDRPIWHALKTRQAEFAVGTGNARRYATDIGPLAGAPDGGAGSLRALANPAQLRG